MFIIFQDNSLEMIIIIQSQRSLLGNDSGPRFSQESDTYADNILLRYALNIFMRISTLKFDFYN